MTPEQIDEIERRTRHLRELHQLAEGGFCENCGHFMLVHDNEGRCHIDRDDPHDSTDEENGPCWCTTPKPPPTERKRRR